MTNLILLQLSDMIEIALAQTPINSTICLQARDLRRPFLISTIIQPSSNSSINQTTFKHKPIALKKLSQLFMIYKPKLSSMKTLSTTALRSKTFLILPPCGMIQLMNIPTKLDHLFKEMFSLQSSLTWTPLALSPPT